MHNIENRFVTGPSGILSGGMYVFFSMEILLAGAVKGLNAAPKQYQQNQVSTICTTENII